jgi:hypothetical protein
MTEHIADDTAHLYRHCEYELCPSCWGIIRNIAIGAEKVNGVRVYDISVTQHPIAPNEDIVEHEIRMDHWLEVTAWSSQRPNSTVVRHIG